MTSAVEKYQAYFFIRPNAPILLREFGFYCMDRWKAEGHVQNDTDLHKLFMWDDSPIFMLKGLGGCEAQFCPPFEEKVLEDRGEYELVQDRAGRSVLCFKGRRSGFMPTYVNHPVKDMKTWEENCLWRMNPDSPERYENLVQTMASARAAQEKGMMIRQYLVGGYMYLRSLIGPEDLLYTFYDDPQLIHACMNAWLMLSDRVTKEYQAYVDIDELQFDEDIAYKCGSLISPDMIKEFLFPYYTQLIQNVAARNRQTTPYHAPGQVHAELASDGNLFGIMDMYRSIGFDAFSPMEAAAGMDVVEVRKKYPDIRINGGFDKRILAQGKKAIDREIERIMPFMMAHGGYYPTCDHGVPEEVSFDDYLYFRKRLAEFG